MTKPKRRFFVGDWVNLTQEYTSGVTDHEILDGPFQVINEVGNQNVVLHTAFIKFKNQVLLSQIHQNWLESAEAPVEAPVVPVERHISHTDTWPIFAIGDKVRYTKESQKYTFSDDRVHVVSTATNTDPDAAGEHLTYLDGDTNYTSSFWLEAAPEASHPRGTQKIVAETLIYQAVREAETRVDELRKLNKRVEASRASAAVHYDRISADATNVRKRLHAARAVLTLVNDARNAELQLLNPSYTSKRK